MPPQTEEQFAKILIKAVDDGLLLLGESARKAIYFHLEKDCSITKEDIPKDMQALENGLKRIFGAGALVVERSILQNLYSKLGLKYEEKSLDFVESFNHAKGLWLIKAGTT